MTGVGRRWNHLHRILLLRFGPGAAKLPSKVTRIHLEIAKNPKAGFGAWKFWKECFPRLKFHNPAIPMIVNRDPRPDANVRPLLTLYFKNPNAVRPEGLEANVGERHQPASSATAESKAQPPDWDERVVEIDLDNKTDDVILLDVLKETGATAVMPTAEEQADIDTLKKLEEEGKVVSAAAKEKNKEKKWRKKKRMGTMLKSSKKKGLVGEMNEWSGDRAPGSATEANVKAPA